MRTWFISALILLAEPATADTIDFKQAARWQVTCSTETQASDPFPEQRAESIFLMWDRRAGVAEMDWHNGVRKILRQLNVDADYTAHFWYGPDTPQIVPEGQREPIDCCSHTLLSFRASGEFALTEHTVTYGGMRALSQEGRCDFVPLPD